MAGGEEVSNQVIVHFDVFCACMKYLIRSHVSGSNIIREQNEGHHRNIQIMKYIRKPLEFYSCNS